MNLIKKPFFWSSAHRETKFTFDFDTLALSSPNAILIESSTGAKLSFVYTGAVFSSTPEAGQYLYVDSGLYKGYHLITLFETVGAFFGIKTDTDFISNQLTGNVKLITSHVFEIYAGYTIGDLATLFPYTKIAAFRSEANVGGYLEVNISGYLKKLFDVINSNDTIEIGGFDVWYNTFRQFFVLLDGALIFTGNTLNASIDQYELNRDYVGTGLTLNSGLLGNHYRNCGITAEIGIQGKGGYVVTLETFDGSVSDAQPDFSSADFNTTDFSTSI